MYTGFLHIHNLLRYVILILFVVQLIVYWKGYLRKGEWSPIAGKILKFLTISLDVQLLFGIVLYFFLSPITSAALNDFGGAMKNGTLRFFAVEHVVAMIAVIALIHIAGSKIKKSASDEKKWKEGAVLTTIAFVILLLAIPWPFYSFGRGWF